MPSPRAGRAKYAAFLGAIGVLNDRMLAAQRQAVIAALVDIVDRVNVAIVDGMGDAGNHAAIPVSAPLVVLIGNKTTRQLRRLAVHGFTAAGEPLVLDGTRLVRAAAAVKPGESLHSIRPKEPSAKPENPVGPFTPAPAGMTAVLGDGWLAPIPAHVVPGVFAWITAVVVGAALLVAIVEVLRRLRA